MGSGAAVRQLALALALILAGRASATAGGLWDWYYGGGVVDCDAAAAEAEQAVAARHRLPIATASTAQISTWFAAHPQYAAELDRQRRDFERHCSAAQATTLPSAGRAAMLIATADNSQRPVVSLGSTTWSLVPPALNQPAAVAVKAEADIPDLKMRATMTLRKNIDPTLQATHTIDLKFYFADGAPITGFKDAGLPQMRKEDSAAAEALTSVKVKISDTYFLIALAKGDTDTARNLDLMQTRAWFDFPLLLNDDRIAKVVFQKSPEGQAMLDKAFEAWNAALSEPPVPAGKAMQPPVSTDKPPEPPVSGETSAIPFINHRGAMAVNVLVGGHAVQMILDTGATISSIPSALADQLIAEGHATEGRGGDVTFADGSSHHERAVVVDAVTIGNHTRSQVEMTVLDGEPLLGLPLLKAIGNFSIDAQHDVLTFSSPSTGSVASAPAPEPAPAPAPEAGADQVGCSEIGQVAEDDVAKQYHLPVAEADHATLNKFFEQHPDWDRRVAARKKWYETNCRPD
jgi:hypothetical protein